jgi:hypothetical protein
MSDITTHTATAVRNARGYVVTIDRIRVKGSAVTGEGFTRDAAAADAKRNLARRLNVPTNTLTLIVSGDE